MWSLTTDTGRYAVKVFDPTIDHTRSPNWRTHLNEAITLELAASTAGLPVPRPIPVTEPPPPTTTPQPTDTAATILADLPTADGVRTVRVHEWADGTPVPDTTADPDLAESIGRVLGTLHALPVPCHHTHALGLTRTQSDQHLLDLLTRAHHAGAPWAPALDRARAAYATVRELADRRSYRTWPLITTHRDLGPKNVLVSPSGHPVILDWDVAGPWTAEEETAAAAMEWAGVLAGPPNRDAVEALLSGYRATGRPVDLSGPEVFTGWLIKHANWTEMHVRHALDPTLPDSRRKEADHALPALLDQLERFAAGILTWAHWLTVP